MFWAVSDVVMLYPDRISVSFTTTTKSSLIFKHKFKEQKYFIVYSDYFRSINWNWSPIGLSAIKTHSKRKSLSQSTYMPVCMNKKWEKREEKPNFLSKDKCLDFLNIRSLCLPLSVMSVVGIYPLWLLLQEHITPSKKIKPSLQS